jgi:hypothetical protein
LVGRASAPGVGTERDTSSVIIPSEFPVIPSEGSESRDLHVDFSQRLQRSAEDCLGTLLAKGDFTRRSAEERGGTRSTALGVEMLASAQPSSPSTIPNDLAQQRDLSATIHASAGPERQMTCVSGTHRASA